MEPSAHDQKKKNQYQEIAHPDDIAIQSSNTIPLRPLDQFRSSYWSGAVAALGLRYLPKIFSRNFFKTQADVSYNQQHAYSAVTGSILMGMTGFYANKTYSDIKAIFSEAVGWEMGKDPENIGFMDLWNSKNSMVQQTMRNYVWFNLRRVGVNMAFFLPFMPGFKQGVEGLEKGFSTKINDGELGVDLGVSANAAYLLSDVLNRKQTPFEALQSLINAKINHLEHFSDRFVGTDLLNIYERHAVHDKNESFLSLRGTEKWDEAMELFDRMAELLNEKYRNEVPHEEARFGFSKFIHLLGTQKIDPDHIKLSRIYVEIANQYGVKEVDIAAEQIAQGKSLEKVMARYPLVAQAAVTAAEIAEKENPAEARTPAHAKIIEKKQPVESHAERYAAQSQEAHAQPSTLSI
ncbi:MAG: hypothetical protein SFX19_03875 [Alphaproteobacteria bacterium]|nr:hypothetical protein [Alphaproteobacteria bacterium]